MADNGNDSDALASKDSENENNNVQVCEICKMILSEDVTMQQHILSTHHEKCYKIMRKNEADKEDYGLYIRGYGPRADKNQILSLFAKYGTIMWAHYGYDFLLLDYTDEKSMNSALKKQHYINGTKLLVKRKESRKSKPEPDRPEEDEKETIDKLKGIDTFNKQYDMLIAELQPDPQAQCRTYERVCEDLFQILHSYYPYCKVFPFGSTITGLSFKKSDLDIYIFGINNGEEVRHLYKIKRVLLDSRFFSNTIVIANAKIPIMKCVHMRTKLNCDINIRNMLGVCNSKLILYYLKLAPKIKTIIIILKFWGKVHKLTGQNHLFTNYSLTLMLLFFLQHQPYHVPTVYSLQRDPSCNNIQDGWNGGFRELYRYPSKLHEESVVRILLNFFRFYTDFEYSINVINPYLGIAIRKEAFGKPETLPCAYAMYIHHVKSDRCKPLKIESSVCVQDPFEHCRNTTPVVTDSTLMAFINLCRSGAKICEEGEDNFLYKLFTIEPENFRPQLLFGAISRQCVIPMGLNNSYLYKKVNMTSQKDRKKEIFSLWIDSFNKFTKTILCDVFCFEVKEIEHTAHKNMKKEGQTDIHDQVNEQRFMCTAMLNLWSNRKTGGKLTRDLEKAPVLEKEIAISKKLLDIYKDIKPNESILECEVILAPKEDPPGITVEIKKIKSYKKIFKSFADFYISHFPNWFKTYEKELCSKS